MAGHCIDCAVGEVGELLGPIKEVTVSRFEGYTDRAATDKKVLVDVFAKGDRYFRSGDLFVRDRNGYFRFVDRVGDTFRYALGSSANGEGQESMGARAGAGAGAAQWRLARALALKSSNAQGP